MHVTENIGPPATAQDMDTWFTLYSRNTVDTVDTVDTSDTRFTLDTLNIWDTREDLEYAKWADK